MSVLEWDEDMDTQFDNEAQASVDISEAEIEKIHENSRTNTPVSRPRASREMGEKLHQRKVILRDLKRTVNMEMLFVSVGIVFMLIDNELTIDNPGYTKDGSTSIGLRVVVTLSTVLLMVSIVYYYYLTVKLRMVCNALVNMIHAVTFRIAVSMVVELVLCAIHPMPVSGKMRLPVTTSTHSVVHLDGILSILMCFRLYIFIRCFAVNTDMYLDNSLRSLCSVNGIDFDTTFIVKAYFSRFPGTVLACVVLTALLIQSWAVRTCENFYTDAAQNDVKTFQDSMWLISITFLTIGYGDMTAKSYCGRFISVLTGFLGVCATALVIAVLSKKMERSKSETLISQFATRGRLEKKKKRVAAHVVQDALRLWIHKRRCALRKTNSNSKVEYQLKKSVSKMHEIRQNKIILEQDAAEIYGETAAIQELKMLVDRTRADIQKLDESFKAVFDSSKKQKKKIT